MLSFKTTVIPYITVFFIAVSVFADDVEKQAANNPQVKNRGHATDGLIVELLKIGDSYLKIYQFSHAYYADFIKKKKDEEKKDAIEINKDEEADLFKRYREIQNALKTTEKDELADNIKKLSDILIESNRLADEFYNKVMDTLKGDEAKDYEYAHKNHKSLVFMHILEGFNNMIKVLNSVLPEKVPDAKLKEFGEQKNKVREWMTKIEKKEGDYNAHFDEMLNEVHNATGKFKNAIESSIDAILNDGEKIDGNFISSINTVATTVTQRSNAILPGLLAIAISSLIFIMS